MSFGFKLNYSKQLIELLYETDQKRRRFIKDNNSKSSL